MKTNWIKTVNDINHKRFKIPPGWETKEQVAESLQCSPDKVADMLKPGIAAGDIDRQDFPVWDEKRRMSVKVPCYRVAGANVVTPSPVIPSIADIPAIIVTRILANLGKYPDRPDSYVAKYSTGATKEMVAAVRAAQV